MRRTVYHLSLCVGLVGACADDPAASAGPGATDMSSSTTAEGTSAPEPTDGDPAVPTTGEPGTSMTGGTDESVTTDAPPEEDPPVLLQPVDQLIRASMAIRGVRPAAADLADVAADPDPAVARARVESHVDLYLADDLFLETVKDLYAEALLLRLKQNESKMFYDLDFTVGDPPNQLPRMDDTTYLELMTEEPLEFIAWVASDPERPFTDIMTSDRTVVSWIGATVFRIKGYDFAQKDTQPFQVVEWQDDLVDDEQNRPGAGLLAHTVLWRRHVSNGNNYQRGRAAMISRVFMCDDFVKRDVPPFNDIDLSDEEKVTMALQSNPGCVSCHVTLDPLANFLAGISTRGVAPIRAAYGYDPMQIQDLTCLEPGSSDCYPLETYKPKQEGSNEAKTGRVAGFFGVERPADEPPDAWDAAKLGELLVADPRFAQCTARRFYSFMAQVDLDELPFPLVERFTEAFVGDDSSFDLRRLVREIVLSPEFMVSHAATGAGADDVVGLKTIRPEQLARTVEDLTGFVWRGTYAQNIGPQSGKFPLLGSDTFGYRSLAGGIDGRNVTIPTHTYTPTRTLTVQALAGEAAGFVVDRDFAKNPGKRRLLALVEADQTDEGAVKRQIAALHLRVLGEPVAEDSAEVQDSYDLWLTGGPEPPLRWKLLLATMLQDHRIAFF